MSDNASQPTSVIFMCESAAPSESNRHSPLTPIRKAMPILERLIRTVKEEQGLTLREWSAVEGLAVEMEKFVEYFNENYPHSALGYTKRRMGLKQSG